MSILKEKNRPLNIATHGSSAGAHLCSLITLALPGECGDVCELKNEWVRPYKCALQATPVDFLPWEAMMPITWGMFTSIASGESGNGGTIALLGWCAYFLPISVLAYKHFQKAH